MRGFNRNGALRGVVTAAALILFFGLRCLRAPRVPGLQGQAPSASRPSRSAIARSKAFRCARMRGWGARPSVDKLFRARSWLGGIPPLRGLDRATAPDPRCRGCANCDLQPGIAGNGRGAKREQRPSATPTGCTDRPAQRPHAHGARRARGARPPIHTPTDPGKMSAARPSCSRTSRAATPPRRTTAGRAHTHRWLLWCFLPRSEATEKG